MITKLLSLRKFSLRWAISITIIATVVVGLFSIVNGRSLGVTGIVGVISTALFYITFAVHAINDDQKAIRTSYMFIAAYVISFIGTFSSLNESPDFASLLVDDFVSGNDGIGAWTNRTIGSAAPYTFFMNVLILAGFLYARKHINKKFSVSWWFAIAGHIASTLAVLSVLILQDYNTHSKLNNISSLLAMVLMVMLFFIKEKGSSKEGVTVSTQTPINETKNHNDMSSKSEQLIKLKSLLDSGVLTQEEFNSEKKKILNS